MVNYILREIKNKEYQKKGISEMISYVLLMSMVIFISVAVYIWVKSLADVGPPVTCPEGTSLVLNDYKCVGGSINFTLKNNGRFTINGTILKITNSTGREPIIALVLNNENDLKDWNNYSLGHYLFARELKPENSIVVVFKNQSKKSDGTINDLGFNKITKISIQPFILDKRGVPILCTDAKINQEIENCNF
jgi:hypothetical protein